MGGVPVRSPHHPTSFPSVRPAFHAPQPRSPGTWGSELVSLLVAGATVRGLRGPQRGGAADVTAVSTGLCACTGEAGEPPRREGGRGARAGGPPAGPAGTQTSRARGFGGGPLSLSLEHLGLASGRGRDPGT